MGQTDSQHLGETRPSPACLSDNTTQVVAVRLHHCCHLTNNYGLCCTFLTLHIHNGPGTHTHPFNGPFSGTTWVSRYQKGKTNLDFTEARDSEWQWHQLGHMQVCISLQTDNHASTPPLNGPGNASQNSPFPCRHLGTHLIHGSLGPSKSQTASRSVNPFLWGSCTDTETTEHR